MFLDVEPGPGGAAPLLFTENETTRELLFGGENASPYVKDAIGTSSSAARGCGQPGARRDQVRRALSSSTSAPGEERVVRLRL
jgi:hypothetical protein